MARKMTTKQFRALIKEEASKLHRRTLLENERKGLMKELGNLEVNDTQVPQVLIDNFIDGLVDASQNYGDKFSLFVDEDKPGYSDLSDAAYETIISTDSGDVTTEDLIKSTRKYVEGLWDSGVEQWGIFKGIT